MNLAIWKIEADHLRLLQIIEDNDGEITEEIDNALTLSKERFEVNAVSYVGIVKTLESDESIIDQEIERLKKMKERKARAKGRLEAKLKDAMILFDVPVIETPLVRVSLRSSESVEVEDINQIPADLKRIKLEESADKKKIKELLKGGVSVPGASLKSNKNLQIK